MDRKVFFERKKISSDTKIEEKNKWILSEIEKKKNRECLVCACVYFECWQKKNIGIERRKKTYTQPITVDYRRFTQIFISDYIGLAVHTFQSVEFNEKRIIVRLNKKADYLHQSFRFVEGSNSISISEFRPKEIYAKIEGKMVVFFLSPFIIFDSWFISFVFRWLRSTAKSRNIIICVFGNGFIKIIALKLIRSRFFFSSSSNFTAFDRQWQ